MAVKKKVVNRRGKRVNPDPVFEGCESWSGQKFLREQHKATDYYRTEYKASDLLPDYFKWMSNNGYSKTDISHCRKHGSFLNVAAIYARCINTGMVNSHQGAIEHWETLPGTTGNLRPTSEFLHSKAKECLRIDNTSLMPDSTATTDTKETTKKTIQDHLKEKAGEMMGDLEQMFDDYIDEGMPKAFKQKPFTVLNESNLGPQFINKAIGYWEGLKDEMLELQAGECEQLNEGYAHWNKIQVRNVIKFIEVIIADCNGYLQLKKSNKKPRTRKPVSPEKLTRKFKYLKEDTTLNIKSEKVTELAEAGEAWFYDTKKRKLIHVVADQYSKTFTVKGSTLIGIDASKTVQKTLRKPVEQLKEFIKASVPNKRKFYDSVKAVEIKYTGRGSDNLLLLSIR
jgi:hypothetical protein